MNTVTETAAVCTHEERALLNQDRIAELAAWSQQADADLIVLSEKGSGVDSSQHQKAAGRRLVATDRPGRRNSPPSCPVLVKYLNYLLTLYSLNGCLAHFVQ